MNPFHEEVYIYATRRVEDASHSEWTEVKLEEDDLEFKGDNQVRAYLQKLPEYTKLQFRVCAENAWGRSPWSEEVSFQTYARPKDGGFIGPLGPAGKCLGSGRDQYRWTQKRGEVVVKVPIAADWLGRDIKFTHTPSRIEILHVPRPPGVKTNAPVETTPQQVILAGRFPKKVRQDEVFWDIEETDQDGRHISIQMTKAEGMDKWPCLIEEEGHPRIDERLVRIYTQEMDRLGPGGIDIFE